MQRSWRTAFMEKDVRWRHGVVGRIRTTAKIIQDWPVQEKVAMVSETDQRGSQISATCICQVSKKASAV